MSSGVATRSQSRPRRSSRLSGAHTPQRGALSQPVSDNLGKALSVVTYFVLELMEGGSTMYVQIEVRGRQKKRKRLPSDEPESTPVAINSASAAAIPATEDSPRSPLSRRAQLSQQNLLEREASLKVKESELRRRELEIDQTRKKLHSFELNIAQSKVQLETRRRSLVEFVDQQVSPAAESVLQQLEDDYTCPLCLDVMTCPYSLTARQCGHTFCGVCLLQWYFSCLHDCGGWHIGVECPVCRASTPIPPGLPPRPSHSCPFIPNRIVSNKVTDIVVKLHSIGGVGSPAPRGSGEGSTKKKKSKTLDERAEKLPPPVLEWAEGGPRRNDWVKKEERILNCLRILRVGRTEMAYITGRWELLTPNDFLNVKNRLGV
ncbi:hypothetical protein EW146_g2545 [Bondarzewia mesenterica]|uniref:RING-type domain-containing protein n=1 Tax=Bondarzewia mesenterica TaxID=1095465 RepID=A0A4S4M0B3_9AGAM|nr:hypothetical protein EW146_g2545 [Bondarzewia mesenterica]